MTAKRRAGWAAVASVLWLLAAGAAAQGPYRPQGRNANGDGPRRMLPDAQRPDRFEQQRPQPPEQSSQGFPRDAELQAGGKRLSPEERRQLRRDVHNAGRDLYPERMPPGRREPGRQ